MKIAVIGGGISGLCAALRLKEAGVDSIKEIVVFEKTSQPGGLLQSTLKDGYWWDNGAFKFKDTNYLVKRLPEVFEPFEGYQRKVWIRDSLHEFPFKLKELISSSSPPALVGAAMGYSISTIKQQLGFSEPNLKVWLKNRMTGEFLDKSGINTYIEKLQGLPTSELSPTMGEKRLKYIHNMTRPGKIVKNVMSMNKNGKKNSKGHQFVYPKKNGVGSISNALASLCQEKGITIRYKTDVQSIQQNENNGYDIEFNENKKSSKYTATHVISSIPLNLLALKMKSQLPEEIFSSSQEIKFMDMQLAFFIIKRPFILSPFMTLYSFSKKHVWKRLVARSLENGETSILVEATYNPATTPPTKNISDVVEENLTKEVNLFKPEEIICKHSTTVNKAYPIYDIGFEDRVQKIISEIENDRFQIIGRQGRFFYSSTPPVIDSAFNAADKVLHNITRNQ